MGHLPFLGFFQLVGTLSDYAHVLSDPASSIPTVGASGAIAGVMGGYLLLFPRDKIDILILIKILTTPAWIMLLLWFAMQFVSSLGFLPDEGGVAYWAHTGDFVAGLLLTLSLWLKRGDQRFWHATRGHPPHPRARYGLPKVKRK